ncbi:glutaminyl-tRNA synthase (glutamine-hydrolyzing) subunit A [Candidatus Nomurabacteria bacterium RIFCSPLOWO2_01_FULL_36_10b]|uniref:Glutamyl-tRNA(Gln) amidotransferase subunit A n=1 Tax=Candidatus Nomurabacteria bacterium RIFCSPLOWO2_01_FULL_36_10b TaxID=1801766 RepID=A0A1F6WNM2_9BACT|nr:MAG: glutaminyl-tRNA synthase (glutamine-hydrolyzing) subunit A [Candidatus Nomurabacteria bacterium RIFCSPLOWO2_01_FULL_36_10b]
MNLENLTILQARNLLDNKQITVRTLVDHYRRVISEKNHEINAYIEIFTNTDAEIDRAQKMIDKGEQKTLTGIPYALKDNILYKDHQVTSASKILEGYVASYDSHVIECLKEEGAIPIGRTNMDEFAMGSSTEYSAYGPTKNPLDASCVPGGSSGGPAAAVAMDSCVFALASDTAGSIRQPASFCGIVGLCPTYGAVSRSGLISLGSSLDCIGPLTKTTEDAQIIYNIINAYDYMDSTSVPLEKRNMQSRAFHKPKKIGIPREFVNDPGISSDMKASFDRAVSIFIDAGYEIVDIEIPHIALSLPVYYIILPAEASSNLARFDGVRYGIREKGEDLLETYIKTRGEGFGKEVRRRIILGTYVLSAGYRDSYYGQATRLRSLIREEFINAFKKVDVIITPTTSGGAFRFGEKSDPVAMYISDLFTVPANIAGIPAISVSFGKTKDGMPLGMQIIASHFNEDALFVLGKVLEDNK